MWDLNSVNRKQYNAMAVHCDYNDNDDDDSELIVKIVYSLP
jgi:hypothetical protein